jgi:exosortase family protein XrtM
MMHIFIMQNPIKRDAARQTGKFILLFALYFFLGSLAYQVTRSWTAPVLVNMLNARPAAFMIQVLTPSHHIRAEGPVLVSDNVRVNIAEGCEGIEAMLLVLAGILAYRANAARKLTGIAGGLALLYAANLVRVVGLYYTFAFRPGLFDVMHTIIGQTFIVVLGVIYFFLWTGWSGTGRAADAG